MKLASQQGIAHYVAQPQAWRLDQKLNDHFHNALTMEKAVIDRREPLLNSTQISGPDTEIDQLGEEPSGRKSSSTVGDIHTGSSLAGLQ
jgi:hypothetical protein